MRNRTIRLVVPVCSVLLGCSPEANAAENARGTAAGAIETIVLAPGAKLPGLRHMGVAHGVELWSDGDIWVRVRRVQP